jgi:ubiquinol-cytochrome c reductase iron-sulfur subunit
MSDSSWDQVDSIAPEDEVDEKRRRFLVKATGAMGAVGVIAAGVPFVSSMNPSRKAEAAGGPVEVKIAEMKPGDQLTVIWRGKPIWIIKRDANMLATLAPLDAELRDPDSRIDQQPDYARNEYRSRRKDILVLVGVCTHLGCAPTYRPDPKGVAPDWPGGFFCSCHGSKFDFAGRVYKGVPAPINLEVPPYAFKDKDTLIIGVDSPSEVV